MCYRIRFIIITIASCVVILAPATSSLAATSSASFRQACEQQLSGLEADARAIVADWQNKADAALAQRNAAQAARALESARSLTANVAGYSGSIFVKCLGESTYRSYFETQHGLYRLEARHNKTNTQSVIQAALFDAANDPGKDADSVLATIPLEPRAYRTAMNSSEGNLDLVENHRKNGAFILPEEEALMRISKKVIDRVAAEAKQQARTALTNEDTEFNRPATRREKDAAANVSGAGEMAQAMTGVKMNTMSPQLITLQRQVTNSREWLSKASAWEIKPGGQRPQSYVRAEKRGDTLLARANAKSSDLTLRDKLYDYAQRYYRLCNCNDKAARTAKAHDAIRPALQAQEERQHQQIEKARAEMKHQAEGMKGAVDKMKKTEAEKQQFKKEADELEEELGF
jgi:hypothetical protein